MGYSGAGGKLIDEKNKKQKISWHCPFNNSAVSSLDIYRTSSAFFSSLFLRVMIDIEVPCTELVQHFRL